MKQKGDRTNKIKQRDEHVGRKTGRKKGEKGKNVSETKANNRAIVLTENVS